MPKLSNLARKSAKFKIEFEGEEPLNIEYYPGRASDELFLSVAGFEDFTGKTAKATLYGFNSAIATLIKEWDLQNDDETIIDLTPEAVAKVYLPLKIKIFKEIKLDMQGGN